MKVLRIQVITPEGRQAVQMFSDRPELILEFIESFYLEPWWASILVEQASAEEWERVGRNGAAQVTTSEQVAAAIRSGHVCRIKATVDALQRGEWRPGAAEGEVCGRVLIHHGLHGLPDAPKR